MKKLICLLLFSSSFGFVFSNGPLTEGKVHVLAFSGLKIRTAPNLDSKVLDIVPFGESIELIEKGSVPDVIEWISGHWSRVDYHGTQGYVFDGFLTKLPVPVRDYELTQNDLDLSYTILAWAENNFDYIQEPDTVESNQAHKLTQYLQHNIMVTRTETDQYFKSTIEIPNFRIGEAYNLVKSMLLTKNERKVFDANALFISNRDGIIDKIKIDIDKPVEIKKTHNDSIKISVVSFHEGCGI